MRQIIKEMERNQLRSKIPDFDVGDTVCVSVQIIEGQKTRVQDFEGTVIARKHKGARETFTVRKISSGVGVERIFPLHSPRIVGVRVVRKGDVRRAKLYYLRKRVGKKARVRERAMTAEEMEAARAAEAASRAEPVVEEAEEPTAEGEPVGAERPEAEAGIAEPSEEPAPEEGGDAGVQPEGEIETEPEEEVGEREGEETEVDAPKEA
jgi:large subunit ribosomal protein L19